MLSPVFPHCSDNCMQVAFFALRMKRVFLWRGQLECIQGNGSDGRLLTIKGEFQEWDVPQTSASGTRVVSEALPYLMHVWAGWQDNEENCIVEAGGTWPLKEKQWIGQSVGSSPLQKEQFVMEPLLAWSQYREPLRPHLMRWPRVSWCRNWESSSPEKEMEIPVQGRRGEKDRIHTGLIKGMSWKCTSDLPSPAEHHTPSPSPAQQIFGNPGLGMYYLPLQLIEWTFFATSIVFEAFFVLGSPPEPVTTTIRDPQDTHTLMTVNSETWLKFVKKFWGLCSLLVSAR